MDVQYFKHQIQELCKPIQGGQKVVYQEGFRDWPLCKHLLYLFQ